MESLLPFSLALLRGVINMNEQQQIKDLAKEFCEGSGCHHKCLDTTDCIVEDKAQLFILGNHLPSTLTNDEKVSEKGKQSIKEEIVDILLNFTKDKHIHISSVVLELYAEELIKHGLTIVPTRCQHCTHRNEDGFCYVDVEGVSYKKTHEDGYCDRGERRENGTK